MRRLWVVLAILLGVFLVVRVRERLEPTDKIKAPTPLLTKDGQVDHGKLPEYDSAEKDRIWGLMPVNVKDWVLSTTGGATADEQNRNAKTKIATLVATAYYGFYKREGVPVTLESLRAWLGGPNAPPAYGDDKRMNELALKAYFIDQSPPPPSAVAASGATSGAASGAASGPGSAAATRSQIPSNISVSITVGGVPVPTTVQSTTASTAAPVVAFDPKSDAAVAMAKPADEMAVMPAGAMAVPSTI